MQAAILVAAMLVGAGDPSAVPPPVPTGPGSVMIDDAPAGNLPPETRFAESGYAAMSRPYSPSISVYYPSPSYDCYSHNHGRLDCYPGFCERHYRRPYNYRVKFDYPWHEDVYRNWPDAQVCEEGVEMPMVANARAMYSGQRRTAVAAKPGSTGKAVASRNTLEDAPLPSNKTLR